MRDLPDDLSARLGGATTICLCWRLTLSDGAQLGFTDHDSDILFGGVAHRANSGWRAGEIEQRLGLRVSTTRVAGALDGACLDAESIAAGRLDGASVITYAVDWMKPEAHVELDRSEIGTVTRQDGAFIAELRSPAQRLEAPTGRLFQTACDAELGDARCGVLVAPLTQATTVRAFDPDFLVSVAPTGRPSGWFSHGLLLTPSGERLRIREHRVTGAGDSLSLWGRPRAGFAAGQAVSLIAGCDKSHAQCRDRFANIASFRGFPHMPGNDLVLAYARADDVAMDGGSLFR